MSARACALLYLTGAVLQVCWEKFCEYWDVEGRYVPVTKDYPVSTQASSDSTVFIGSSETCHLHLPAARTDKHVEKAEGLGISMQIMNPEDARKYMDENTIGLIVMFGSTYNGQFEDVVLADKIVGASAASIHPTHCTLSHARAPCTQESVAQPSCTAS